MELNEEIFKRLTENETLMKVCTGQATEEEVKEMKKEMNIPENIDLQQFCSLGYNIASKLDTNDTFEKETRVEERLDEIDSSIYELAQQVKILNGKIDLFLGNSPKFTIDEDKDPKTKELSRLIFESLKRSTRKEGEKDKNNV